MPQSSTIRARNRKDRLKDILEDLRTLRTCGPSDDPDEQTSVIESYRYLLIHVRTLAKGLVSTSLWEQIEAVPFNIESIYDVYTSKAHLDAIAPDIRAELQRRVTTITVGPQSTLIAPAIIQKLGSAKSANFDLSRLVLYCDEINSCFYHGNFVACLLLMRTVLNHVPPIFGHATFAQVAANASRGVKGNLEILGEGMRKIADLYAHQAIRAKEQCPTRNQVEPFRPQFEILLQEVLNVL